jgi:hypothetical protein
LDIWNIQVTGNKGAIKEQTMFGSATTRINRAEIALSSWGRLGGNSRL